ncbi:Sphingolipid C9-methyltransferase 2 like protein [Verticillium longisporum]|nr:Sphingolipid C9-methyltransferase 2 like protein [Verticillium longisporum]
MTTTSRRSTESPSPGSPNPFSRIAHKLASLRHDHDAKATSTVSLDRVRKYPRNSSSTTNSSDKVPRLDLRNGFVQTPPAPQPTFEKEEECGVRTTKSPAIKNAPLPADGPGSDSFSNWFMIDEEQVRDHYDRGDDFYGWFLGPRMIYTSGVISDIDREETLEEMQDNKLAIEVRLSGEGDKAKAFVDVWRRYTVADGKGGDAAPAIEERRTLVFMPEVEALTSDAAAAAAKSPPRIIKSPHTPDYAFALTPNRALLANFSALTYNAHSIHLDAALTLAEGHRALLVHGPLTLALAFAALRGAAPREGVRRLEYRNVRPLYCGDRLRVCVREKEAGSRTGAADERRWDVWVEGPAGGMAVKGTAVTGAF